MKLNNKSATQLHNFLQYNPAPLHRHRLERHLISTLLGVFSKLINWEKTSALGKRSRQFPSILPTKCNEMP